MPDLGTQLRDYYDAAVTLIEPEDVIQQRVPQVAHPPRVHRLATQQPGWVVALSVAAVVLLATASVTWVTQRGPSDSTDFVPVGPVPEQVVFSSADTPPVEVTTESYDLYAIDPDGSNLTQLTTTDANEWSPSWAPDGSRIAFVSDGGGIFSIYLMNPDGSDVTLLTEGVFPTWSPDGERIAFDRIVDNRRSVWVINADGTGEREVTSHDGYHSGPGWSPDGSHLVYASDPNASRVDCEGQFNERNCNTDIYVIGVDGSNPTRLTEDPGPAGFPEWSPDGSRIAYHSNQNGDWESFDIYTVKPDGTDVTNLTNSANFDRFPSWSPDGTQIVFESNRMGTPAEDPFGTLNYPTQAYTMDADGSNPRLLTNMPHSGEASQPDW